MEALVIVSTALALVLLVVWALRSFQTRRKGEPTPPDAVEAGHRMRVVVELPRREQATFAAALERRLDDEALAAEVDITASVSAVDDEPEHGGRITLEAQNGPRTLDVVLRQLRAQGYRVQRTEGPEIVLSGWTTTEARVVVSRPAPGTGDQHP